MNGSRQIRRNAARSRSEEASTFVLVLWIAFGLVSLTLYFGSSMSLELRSADNRLSGLDADQAIEGAARYISSVLALQINDGSNGYVPDVSTYLSEAVPVGGAHFWLIGRDTNNPAGAGQINFGLVDEASKLNLNSASSNMLYFLVDVLPRANPEVVGGILDWRSTNGGSRYQAYYASQPQSYSAKASPFETVDELRLVYGADIETFAGEDANRNGILDPNETDINHDGHLEPGLLEYVTVYSREPNTRSNGQARVSIRTVTGANGPLPSLLQTALGSTRANQVLANLGLLGTGPVGPGRPPVIVTRTFTSPLQLFRDSRMTADEFSKIIDDITVTNGAFIEGRVNINTASATVLATLPGFENNPGLVDSLINYRNSNPGKLGSVAWIVEALGQNNNSVLNTLVTRDCITTRSYQYSADVAALGTNGRGYRRARFVFDTSGGSPRIIYRQDLTHLGWALGADARQTWLAKAAQ